MRPVRRVTTRPAAQTIAEEIRFAVHRGELSAGDRLPPERVLAEDLGVGRETLRDALAILDDEGYLTRRRGSGGGTFVTDLQKPKSRWVARIRKDRGHLEDLLELRIALERHTARLASRRRRAADLARLERSIRELTKSNDLRSFRQADARFHVAVACAARNSSLEQAIADVRGELFIPFDSYSFDPAVDRNVRDHTEILAAIRAADEHRAGDLMEEHIAGTRDWLLGLLLDRERPTD